MDEREVIEVLKALGEPTRLRLMLLLANAKAPMPVGAIAQNLNVRQNTLSAHIAVLARCDLILGHREGRNILYAANPRKTLRLKDYLAKTLCKA
jgi:ArsR family transcriptional regulator, arsenate/arsenite/antimonite-responsive transcriptional repressor